jgi:hypothetical protein
MNLKWEDDQNWVGYDVNINQAEPFVEELFCLGFVHDARILGRETAHGLRMLLSFESEAGRRDFIRDLKRSGHKARQLEPTPSDLEAAKPIGEVFPFSLEPVFQALVDRVATAMSW